MSPLILYENAKKALAELHKIDEVKHQLDEAAALQEYARRSKDTELVERATEYRLYAERRAGEILIKMAKTGERTRGFGNENAHSKKHNLTKSSSVFSEGSESLPKKPEIKMVNSEKPKTLADMNITQSQSKNWQRKAEMPEDLFGSYVETEKEKERERITKEFKKEEPKTILSIDNELDNRLSAMEKYLDKNIKDLVEIVASKEFLRFSVLKNYSLTFYLLGQKLIKLSEDLKLPKVIN
jgi:hypothetical protein